jgi:hypothetical protein
MSRWELRITNYVAFGFYIQDVLKNKIVAATPNLFPDEIKATSQDIFDFYFYIQDAGYLTWKYRNAGYSNPLPEDLTMQVSVIGKADGGSGGAVISESPREYITTWTAYSAHTWRYRLSMPPVYKYYVFDLIEVLIWSGRSNIVLLRVPLKHIKLSKLEVTTDKSVYSQGEEVKASVIGYDQDNEVIHHTIRFPLNIKLLKDGQVIDESRGNDAYSGYEFSILTTSLSTGDYVIQVSENDNYDPDSVLRL